CLCRVFFFSSRRRHTRFSRDWSSDVCSSDLEDDRGDEEVPEDPVVARIATVAWGRQGQLVHCGGTRWTLLRVCRCSPPGAIRRRSEERRVGKERGTRGAADAEKRQRYTKTDT